MKNKFKKLVIFYSLVAALTYALILRVESLEQNPDLENANNFVINLW